MQRLLVLGCAVFLLFWGQSVSAQQPATAVQLPTYRFFTVSTTVSVPDRGGAYLGGVNRSSSGSNAFGAPLFPLRNRGGGRNVGASGLSVHATIHDLQAMDEEILRIAEQRNRTQQEPALVIGAPQDARPMSLQAIEQRKRQQAADKEQEYVEKFQRGQLAEAKGNFGAARIYYSMVARGASGDLKQEAAARLESLQQDR